MNIRLVQFDTDGAWSAEQRAWLDAKLNTVFDAERGDDGYWRVTGETDCPVILVDDEIEECAVLYKKTVVLWSDNDAALQEAARSAVNAARGYDPVYAYGIGKDDYSVADPQSDPDYDPILEVCFGDADCADLDDCTDSDVRVGRVGRADSAGDPPV